MTAVDQQTSPVTVPCDVAVRVTVTAPLRHLCPFRDEVDDGTATISWTTTGRTVELHALRLWLSGFADHQVSHEHLAHRIHTALTEAGVIDVDVSTCWVTAGMGVQVHAVPRQRQLAERA